MAQESEPRFATRPVIIVAVVTIIVVGTLSAIVYYTGQLTGCAGYPPGGNCIAPYNNTFTISVNYTGPWKLNYSGQTNVGESSPTNVTGSRTGTGYFSLPVTLSGLNNRMLTICAYAEKLDSSNSTLYLSIEPLYPKNTSLPYGSVSTCGGVAP